MKRRSVISIILATILLATVCTAPAFAIGPDAFSWKQHVATNQYHPLSGTYFQNKPIYFEGVAYSVTSGQFTAQLQKQVLGIWVNYGTSYTIQHRPDKTWSGRTGYNVDGQWFKVYWPAQGSGNFRMHLKDPTNKQEVYFSQVYFTDY